MIPSGLHVRTFVLIALTVAFNSAGNLLLSVGMKRVGDVGNWSLAQLDALGWTTMTTGVVWLGVMMLALFFVCFMLLLSWADYSFVHPASAVGYALVPLLGYAVVGERVSPLRWGGIALICAGVLVVGRTPVRTAPAVER